MVVNNTSVVVAAAVVVVASAVVVGCIVVDVAVVVDSAVVVVGRVAWTGTSCLTPDPEVRSSVEPDRRHMAATDSGPVRSDRRLLACDSTVDVVGQQLEI